MRRDAISIAHDFMRARKFSKAIIVLQNAKEIYEEIFDYWLLIGTAYLYSGDIGSAWSSFEEARKIKLTDVNLLIGQAAIYLRRGDTDRALLYYLDVLEYDPNNKTAKNAMEFLRRNGDYNTICRWSETGKLAKFYPPIGANYGLIIKTLFSIFIVAAAVFFVSTRLTLVKPSKLQVVGERADLSSIVVSEEDLRNAQEINVTGEDYPYVLTNEEIAESYDLALRYFQSYRDNAAQVEVNRINSSNATLAIKQTSQLLGGYLYNPEPTFDTLTDNPPYADVAKDPLLYLNCFVVWSGRVSNARLAEDGYRCDLLVGYDKGQRVEGIVPVHFLAAPEIADDRPVTMLAKIVADNNRWQLSGRAVYQSLSGALTTPK